MLTVKINSFDNINIYECDSITMAKRGQRMCDCAINDAKKKGVNDPSFMTVTGGVTEMEDGSFKDDSEINVMSHYQPKNSEIIGVICLPVTEKNVVSYQFIFAGETVFVINNAGVEVANLSCNDVIAN